LVRPREPKPASVFSSRELTWAAIGCMLGALACASEVTTARPPALALAATEVTPLPPPQIERTAATPNDVRAVPVHFEPARDGTSARLPWLSPSHIGAAVRAHQAAFGACQSLADSAADREDGAVTVGWLVGADGSVSHVTVGPSTFDDALVNNCVLSVARRVTFPASSSSTQVSWTVRLREASSGALAEASHLDARR
jgi:hypothetical protein